MPAFGYGKPVSPVLRGGGLATGLMLGYPLSQGGGLTVYDASQNARNGSLNGNATWSSSSFGNCLAFDGSSGYVEYSGVTVSAIPITLACWLYCTNTGVTASSAVSLTGGNRTNGWISIGYNSGSGIKAAYVSGSNFSNQVFSNVLVANTWIHVVATFSSSLISLYVNGYLRSTGVRSTAAPTILTTRIGALNPADSDPEYWPGRIDALGIWNRLLSSQEIAALYTDSWQMYRPRRTPLKGPPPGNIFLTTPTSVTVSSSQTVTVVGTNTSWTSSATFFADRGLITNVVIVNATTATFTFTAPAAANVVSITDNTDIAVGTINVVASPPSTDMCDGNAAKRGFTWHPLTDCPPVNV